MPIIRFTDADKLTSILVPTGWYKAEITEIDGPKKSQSEKSVNFFTKFTITGSPNGGKDYAGKELQIIFNTGTRNASVLGTAQFMPHSYYIPIAAAVLNCSRDDVPNDLDTDTLLHKPLDIKVEKGIYEGIPLNTILTFAPAGTGADAKVPF